MCAGNYLILFIALSFSDIRRINDSSRASASFSFRCISSTLNKSKNGRINYLRIGLLADRKTLTNHASHSFHRSFSNSVRHGDRLVPLISYSRYSYRVSSPHSFWHYPEFRKWTKLIEVHIHSQARRTTHWIWFYILQWSCHIRIRWTGCRWTTSGERFLKRQFGWIQFYNCCICRRRRRIYFDCRY